MSPKFAGFHNTCILDSWLYFKLLVKEEKQNDSWIYKSLWL